MPQEPNVTKRGDIKKNISLSTLNGAKKGEISSLLHLRLKLHGRSLTRKVTKIVRWNRWRTKMAWGQSRTRTEERIRWWRWPDYWPGWSKGPVSPSGRRGHPPHARRLDGWRWCCRRHESSTSDVRWRCMCDLSGRCPAPLARPAKETGAMWGCALHFELHSCSISLCIGIRAHCDDGLRSNDE